MQSSKAMTQAFVGTAGWTIPTYFKNSFNSEGTHLEKYSKRLNCVEINSSFYRDHKQDTYKKWSDSTPDDFLFSAKLLNYFTHEMSLTETGPRLKLSLQNIFGLGSKLGALVVQLPPSLAFDLETADSFFSELSEYCYCPILLEPRHLSWTKENALEFLASLDIQKVLADPEPCKITTAQRAPLEKRLRYFRLHGSPMMYKSNYEPDSLYQINSLVKNPPSPSEQTWVIFDNTTYGHATSNALQMTEILSSNRQRLLETQTGTSGAI